MAATDSLSIVIPTWNRNQRLAKTLRMLAPQLSDGVQITILDNCSRTPVIASLPPELAQLATIIRNKHNIGACGNILRSLENVESTWVWVLGDDDDPAPDAIHRIRAELARFPNVDFFDFGHPFGETRSRPCVCRGFGEVIAAMYYPQGDPELYAWSDGHISNEVYRTSLLQERLIVGYRNAHTHYPHIAMLFDAIRCGASCRFTGPLLCTLGTHDEARTSYTLGDIALGWRMLAHLIDDDRARATFLHALDTSKDYGLQNHVGVHELGRDGSDATGSLSRLWATATDWARSWVR